jgi:cell division septal protein FtsQ
MSAPWTPNANAKRRFRDYHKRQYGNPLFRSGRGGSRASARQPGAWKRRTLACLIVLAVGAAAWELFWSPTFRISSVDVQGATSATESRIRDILEAQQSRRTLLIFPQRSIFLFDKTAAAGAIESLFHLEKLTIAKKLPGSLVVTVTEIPMRTVLYENKRFLAMSDTGTVIRELTDREVRDIGDLPPDIAADITSELGAQMVELSTLTPDAATGSAKRNGNGFPLLFDDEAAAGSDPIPGDTIFSEPTLSLILQANTRLPDITGNAVRWFTVRERDEAVDVTMEGDWHLYLTTTLPFEVQGERLGIILKEKVGVDRPRLQYIDLRYNERIFIKLKDDAAPKE